MAKIKVNDKGIARVSLYLNSKNPKDKKIIEFLNKQFNASGFIKDLLLEHLNGH